MGTKKPMQMVSDSFKAVFISNFGSFLETQAKNYVINKFMLLKC